MTFSLSRIYLLCDDMSLDYCDRPAWTYYTLSSPFHGSLGGRPAGRDQT